MAAVRPVLSVFINRLPTSRFRPLPGAVCRALELDLISRPDTVGSPHTAWKAVRTLTQIKVG